MKETKQAIHLATEGHSVAMLIEVATLSISANICHAFFTELLPSMRDENEPQWESRAKGELSKPIYNGLPDGEKYYYVAVRGRHGSSILLDDQTNWTGIEPFLRRLAAKGQSVAP